MAVPAGTYKTYENVGTREDLSDVIYNISPEETPFMTRAGRGSATSTKFEWQTDELAAVDETNAKLEGADADFVDPDPTVRLNNYVQISDKTAAVSGTVEATKRAGRKGEMAYQMAKRSKELKRDMEAIALSNQAAAAGAAGVARTTAGILAFIKTNVDKEGTGTNPVYTDTPSDPRNDGAQRALTEDMVKNVISLCWAAGAEPDTLMCGAFNKGAISAFSGIAAQQVQINSAAPTKIIASASVYVSDFGNLTVVPNRFQRTRDLLVLDFEFLSIEYLRKFRTENIAKTGDSEKKQIIVEWGLKVGNEASQGLVADLTTA